MDMCSIFAHIGLPIRVEKFVNLYVSSYFYISARNDIIRRYNELAADENKANIDFQNAITPRQWVGLNDAGRSVAAERNAAEMAGTAVGSLIATPMFILADLISEHTYDLFKDETRKFLQDGICRTIEGIIRGFSRAVNDYMGESYFYEKSDEENSRWEALNAAYVDLSEDEPRAEDTAGADRA